MDSFCVDKGQTLEFTAHASFEDAKDNKVILQLQDAETGDILAQSSESTIVYNKQLTEDKEFQLVVNT